MFKQVLIGATAVALLAVAQGAHADHDKRWKRGGYDRRDVHYDYARVVDVEPLMRRVRVSVPRRECYMETRYEHEDHDRGYYAGPQPRGSAGSMILGGIVGAAVGNQIGSGDGRRAATVAGAIIGSAVGHDVAARRQARDGYYYGARREPRAYEVERCDTRYEEEYEERIDGYRVTYEYNGRHHHTRLPYDPGDRIRVRVDVRPEDDD